MASPKKTPQPLTGSSTFARTQGMPLGPISATSFGPKGKPSFKPAGYWGRGRW